MVELIAFNKLPLTKVDWINAGWVLMANQGVAGVKIEVLARQLQVSKGSFYWHFQNRKELLESILQRWENETQWLINESQKELTPQARLVKLFSLAEELCNQPDPETAILTLGKSSASNPSPSQDGGNETSGVFESVTTGLWF
jgi:AcrR family transcriptional regulator